MFYYATKVVIAGYIKKSPVKTYIGNFSITLTRVN